MSEEKPTVYILHGDDQFAITGFIESMQAKMDPNSADLNTTRIDGRTASENEIRSVVGAMPFLAERRLVILDQPLSRVSSKEDQERFLALLESVPPTSALVLVIHDEYQGRRGWAILDRAAWFKKWVENAGARVYMTTQALPRQHEMNRWIRQHARELGGRFTTNAAVELANCVGTDTRYAHQEILKILTYVDFSRTVEIEDVQNLTIAGIQTDVFKLVDQVGLGNKPAALKILHSLLEEQDEISIFGMVVRQFRLLLLAREILDQGGSSRDFPGRLGVASFVADRLAIQVQRYSMEDLKGLYRRLLEMDEAAKTGEMPLGLSLDLFVSEL
jgi:DNA polymerase-3 subunit delta